MGFLYLCNKDFEHNSFLVAVSIQKQLLVYNKDRQRKASYSVYELVWKYLKVSVEKVNFLFGHNEQRQKSLASN